MDNTNDYTLKERSFEDSNIETINIANSYGKPVTINGEAFKDCKNLKNFSSSLDKDLYIQSAIFKNVPMEELETRLPKKEVDKRIIPCFGYFFAENCPLSSD